MISNKIMNRNPLFWRPGWASLDFSLISNYVNPYQTPTIVEPWLAKTKFPLTYKYILIRNLQFWSPGWPGLDFHWTQTNSIVTNLQCWCSGWPGLDFHWFQIKCSLIRNLPFCGLGWTSLNFHILPLPKTKLQNYSSWRLFYVPAYRHK